MWGFMELSAACLVLISLSGPLVAIGKVNDIILTCNMEGGGGSSGGGSSGGGSGQQQMLVKTSFDVRQDSIAADMSDWTYADRFKNAIGNPSELMSGVIRTDVYSTSITTSKSAHRAAIHRSSTHLCH